MNNKVLNIDTATIEELKIASFDTAREASRLQQQQEVLLKVIDQRERTVPSTQIQPVAEVKSPEATT
jgi:hypothetical protein